MNRIEALFETLTDKRQKAALRRILQEPSLEKRFELARSALELFDEIQAEYRQILVAFIAETRQRWMDGMNVMQENIVGMEQIRTLYESTLDLTQKAALEKVIVEVSLQRSFELATQALTLFDVSQEVERNVLQGFITTTRQRWMDVMCAMRRYPM